jgi:hypothetical protein
MRASIAGIASTTCAAAGPQERNPSSHLQPSGCTLISVGGRRREEAEEAEVKDEAEEEEGDTVAGALQAILRRERARLCEAQDKNKKISGCPKTQGAEADECVGGGCIGEHEQRGCQDRSHAVARDGWAAAVDLSWMGPEAGLGWYQEDAEEASALGIEHLENLQEYLDDFAKDGGRGGALGGRAWEGRGEPVEAREAREMLEDPAVELVEYQGVFVSPFFVSCHSSFS